MIRVRQALTGLTMAALALSLAAVPADAKAKRKRASAVTTAMPVVPVVAPSETPEQARVRLNAEQAAAAKAQNDKNAATKAAYEAAVAQREAEIARQKAADEAAHAKWLAETVPCKSDPNVRCAKPLGK